jgi:hypothetical protein
VVDDAKAWVREGALRENMVALHVQNGAHVTESASSESLGLKEVRVSPHNVFEGNESRLGTGVVPLPSL